MKKTFKLMAIFATILMIIPFNAVNAATKTDDIIKKLMENESFKDFNGKATYEDNKLTISYNMVTDSTYSETNFEYEGDVISYDSGELETFEDAESVTSHSFMALKIMNTVLQLNGYTKEQILAFEGPYNYATNGIEFEKIGDEHTFTSDDETTTIEAAHTRIKIDIKKANLGDSNFQPSSTTIESLIATLEADKEFTTFEDDGLVLSKNEITYDDETITVANTIYSYSYYDYSYFIDEDNVLSYELTEEDMEYYDFDQAETAVGYYSWALVLLQVALEVNGYTNAQIQEFFQTEGNTLSYELNGIEFEQGEDKTFTSDDHSSSVTVTPFTLKIDLENANLNKKVNGVVEYTVLNGANQELALTSNNKLSFRLSINYDKFINEGKIIIDGKEVSKNNYKVSKGSTVITFNDEYTKTLTSGKHTIIAMVSDGDVKTEFSIVKNPATGDNIMVYATMLGLSIISLTGVGIYLRKNS